jgi:hypothetical protein
MMIAWLRRLMIKMDVNGLSTAVSMFNAFESEIEHYFEYDSVFVRQHTMQHIVLSYLKELNNLIELRLMLRGGIDYLKLAKYGSFFPSVTAGTCTWRKICA